MEVGIGSGQFAIPLGVDTGIEPSKEMRKLAQAKGLDAIEGIGEKLPFNNENFNFVFINTTICFFDNPEKALKEAYRVIKKNGFIVIGFIDKDSKLGKKYLHGGYACSIDNTQPKDDIISSYLCNKYF